MYVQFWMSFSVVFLFHLNLILVLLLICQVEIAKVFIHLPNWIPAPESKKSMAMQPRPSSWYTPTDHWKPSCGFFMCFLKDPLPEMYTLTGCTVQWKTIGQSLCVFFMFILIQNCGMSILLNGAKPSNQILPQEKHVNCNNLGTSWTKKECC